MFKRMGLSSEQVCALGAWKNSTAFDKHYLRLNTCDTARTVAENLLELVPAPTGGKFGASSLQKMRPARLPSMACARSKLKFRVRVRAANRRFALSRLPASR